MTTDADLRYATAEADRTRESRVIRPMGEERTMLEHNADLARRLVEVAGLYAATCAEAAVVAVLRELAQVPDTPNRYALADLADSIERTEEGQ